MAAGGDAARRIVVGYDGSAESKAALQWATGYATLSDAEIEIVTAWEWPRVAVGMPSLPFDRQPEDNARRVAESGAATVGLPSQRTHIQTPQGHAGEALVRLAKEATLLVLGSGGHGPVTSRLLGSVTNYCVHHSATPVAIVRGTSAAPVEVAGSRS